MSRPPNAPLIRLWPGGDPPRPEPCGLSVQDALPLWLHAKASGDCTPDTLRGYRRTAARQLAERARPQRGVQARGDAEIATPAAHASFPTARRGITAGQPSRRATRRVYGVIRPRAPEKGRGHPAPP